MLRSRQSRKIPDSRCRLGSPTRLDPLCSQSSSAPKLVTKKIARLAFHILAIQIELLPFMCPMCPATEYFGGIEIINILRICPRVSMDVVDRIAQLVKA